MQRVLGYYPDWDTRLPAEQIDYKLFTHLCHAFALPKSNGAVETLSKGKILCERAKAQGVKVLLSLGGAQSNKGLTAVINDPSAFDRLVDSLLGQVENTGYAGIDVDWEAHNGAADRENMNRLVTRLRERLGKDRLLTMAAPASAWGGQWFDTSVLLPQIDWLNVMNYDYHGPWSETSGPNANLYPCPGDDGISTVVSYDYWLKSRACPKDKLLLGIPCYGRGFHGRQFGEKVIKGRKAPHEYIDWRDIDALIRMGWKREWDKIGRVPYLLSPRGDEVISYEDYDSALEKGDWAKKMGLGGIFFWEISEDFKDGTHYIVRGARRGFLGK